MVNFNNFINITGITANVEFSSCQSFYDPTHYNPLPYNNKNYQPNYENTIFIKPKTPKIFHANQKSSISWNACFDSSLPWRSRENVPMKELSYITSLVK